MGTVGKRGLWFSNAPGRVASYAPGFNPLNFGPINNKHLGFSLDGATYGTQPLYLILRDNVIAPLLTPNVLMSIWVKALHDSVALVDHFVNMTFRSVAYGDPLVNDTPFVGVYSLPGSNKLQAVMGRYLAAGGPPTYDKILDVPSKVPGEAIGIRAWCVDVGGGETQFYGQYHDGSAWQKIDNLVYTGMEGTIGKYWLAAHPDAGSTDIDEDWIDDFEFNEDASPPEAPPP